jgi:hypothetical protein
MISYKINGNVYDQTDIDYVIHLHKSGNDTKEIANYLDWSFWTVAEILYKFTGYRSEL